MDLARARPYRGYQIHVDYQVGGQMVSGSQLDCHEKKKLAKHHVKDGENYNEEGETFTQIVAIYYINLSLSLSESLSPNT